MLMKKINKIKKLTHPARSINNRATPITLPGFKNLGTIPNGRGGATMVKIDWYKPTKTPNPPIAT